MLFKLGLVKVPAGKSAVIKRADGKQLIKCGETRLCKFRHGGMERQITQNLLAHYEVPGSYDFYLLDSHFSACRAT